MTKSPRPRHVVITRPVGRGRALARAVADCGWTPLSLPGSSLRAVADEAAARRALVAALAGEIVIFTSPVAVQFAARLAPLATPAAVVAIGAATALALARRGIHATAPARADSEGALALPVLADVGGRRAALIGAAGGRGLLAAGLRARGATLAHVHVYRRLAARWDARHLAPLRAAAGPLVTLLTSAETLARIESRLAPELVAKLHAGTAITGSARLDAAARDAGYARRVRAASALDGDLVAALRQLA